MIRPLVAPGSFLANRFFLSSLVFGLILLPIGFIKHIHFLSIFSCLGILGLFFVIAVLLVYFAKFVLSPQYPTSKIRLIPRSFSGMLMGFPIFMYGLHLHVVLVRNWETDFLI